MLIATAQEITMPLLEQLVWACLVIPALGCLGLAGLEGLSRLTSYLGNHLTHPRGHRKEVS